MFVHARARTLALACSDVNLSVVRRLRVLSLAEPCISDTLQR